MILYYYVLVFFFFQAEDGIRDIGVTGVQTCALPIFAGGLLIGLLGRRVADREVATGTILALATALGVLFASLASANAGTTTSVLFGNLLAISRDQLIVYGLFTALVVATLAVLARPLVFASVDPEVAEARGVPVRALGI